ncbi:MAG: hypothetical protein RLZ77_643 [Bacteroidota bacterium]|jgi:opacity protein-like surface antigen
MKKIIFTLLTITAIGVANAQETKYGIKGGIDLVSAKSTASSLNATGFYVGGFAELGLSDVIYIQPSLNYHTASKDGVKFDYMSVPVLVKFMMPDKFNILAGPALYYSMDSEDTNKTRINLAVGGDFEISDNLLLESRYDYGLTGDVKVNHLLFGIGYKF